MKMVEKIRAFAAVEVGKEIQEYVYEAARRINLPGVKAVEKHNIHLTVKFLGSVSFDVLKDIVLDVSKSLKGVEPFTLTTGKAGCFPSERQARVFWFSVEEGSTELKEIFEKVEKVCRLHGIPSENREFHPHITALRLKKPANLSSFVEEINKSYNIKHKVKVDSIVFFKSTLTPKGPIYTKLFTLHLPDGRIEEHS